MEKSVWNHICDVLDDLGSSNLKRFTDKLCDSRLEPRIRRNNVEGKDASDIARLLIEKHTEIRAVEVAVEVCRSIGCNQSADELEDTVKRQCPAPQAVPCPPRDVNTLTASTLQFKQSIIQEKGNNIYNVKEKHSRKRLALIINNVEFGNESMKRNGAQRDEENIDKLLTALGYEVVKHANLSGKEMDEKIRDFAKRKEHADSDSTFVVIMSHGKRDAILGVNYGPSNTSDVLPVDNIYVHLNTSNCPSLRDKPKVILIQACRGGETGGVWVSDSEETEPCNFESDDTFVHKEKDFISLLSCTPDTKSYRHRETGTLFIRYIVEVFNTNAHKDHIEELFRQVMMQFEDFSTLKQMVCKDRTSLVKLFYLFPGL
ncbi:caspase-4-like [Electrophorus electricus]|uniref:Caspase a n=1 Tax=Electrophorus electricus TaxID=8005 RepID=A0A4W4FFZ5_ELEEL|nr:caspase-4-like [Electrophorus electricus]